MLCGPRKRGWNKFGFAGDEQVFVLPTLLKQWRAGYSTSVTARLGNRSLRSMQLTSFFAGGYRSTGWMWWVLNQREDAPGLRPKQSVVLR